MAVMTMRSSLGQSSRSRERTRDRWVPRLRWIPEHSMHMRAPRFRLAQSGSEGSRISGAELASCPYSPARLLRPRLVSAQLGVPGEARPPGWPRRGHSVAVGAVPHPEEQACCRTGQDRHTKQVCAQRGDAWVPEAPSPLLLGEPPVQCAISYWVRRSPRRSCSRARCGRPAWPARRPGCPAEPAKNPQSPSVQASPLPAPCTPPAMPHHAPAGWPAWGL